MQILNKVRKTMSEEVESIKSAIISRVKEIDSLKEEKAEVAAEYRSRIKSLQLEVTTLMRDMDNSERNELVEEASTLLRANGSTDLELVN